MSRIDKPSKRINITIIVRRRIQINTVIAPIPSAWKLGYGEDFDQRDPKAFEFLEFLNGRVKRAFCRKSSNVEFVNDLALHAHSRPVTIMPNKGERIDDLRRTM